MFILFIELSMMLFFFNIPNILILTVTGFNVSVFEEVSEGDERWLNKQMFKERLIQFLWLFSTDPTHIYL